MNEALALLEFTGAAPGILAVDRLLKRSPVARLRCGTVHPGRYLVLVGGSVASVDEAFGEGLSVGDIVDAVHLPDPHPLVRAGALGECEQIDDTDTLAVIETTTSAGLLRCVDAALKAVPVGLAEFRLADDLGGRGLAVLRGELPDVQEALAVAAQWIGPQAELIARTLMPRPDATLRDLLNTGTRFADCSVIETVGAEVVAESGGLPCSWDE